MNILFAAAFVLCAAGVVSAELRNARAGDSPRICGNEDDACHDAFLEAVRVQ